MENNPNKDSMETDRRKLRSYCYIWLIMCMFVLIVCVILSKAEEKHKNNDNIIKSNVIMDDNKPRIYSVLVEGEPLVFRDATHINSKAMAFEAKKIEEIHEEIIGSTLENGSYKKLYSFKHIVNAFAVHTTPSQVKKLMKAKGVKSVEEDKGVKLMTTYTPDFLELPHQVWPKISSDDDGERHAGEDIVIGFVDTGINPTHPSFASLDFKNPYSMKISRTNFSGDCETGPLFPAASCNGKIISARFFSAGARASMALNSSLDILSPYDASGHGSHVASIAAGNAEVPVIVDGFFYGRASGMAPRARIAVYKAIYPSIGTLVDVIAAIDQAIMDGVDVLTLSVGPNEPPVDKPTVLGLFDLAMLLARKAGVFVVQAVGNHGPSPSSVLSYSPWVVGAAAGTTDRSYPASLILDGGETIPGVGISVPTFGGPLLQHRLVLARDAVRTNGLVLQTITTDVEECQRPEYFDPAAVFGSIVICIFSDGFLNQNSTVRAIIQTATTLGFRGFILIANPRLGEYIAEPVISLVPGIMIPKLIDTQSILRYYEEKTYRDKSRKVTQFGARARISDGRNSVFAGKAPVVSRFSSRGPAYIDADRNLLDVLKPDILAPGHQIWGAWSVQSAFDPILTGRNFAFLSGTSMAAPHISGIGALIKQLNPSWTPAMIASAISTTATRYDSSGEVISTESYEIGELTPSNHFDHGSGHVSPARAIDPGLVLPADFEDYISFLCSLPYINPVMVRAATGVLCTSSLSHPANLNHPSVTISALKESLVVKRSFQNVSNKTETYVGSVIPPNGTTVQLNPSWFTVPAQETQDLDIEFTVTEILNQFTFGEVVLTGSLNHIIRIPLSVQTKPF